MSVITVATPASSVNIRTFAGKLLRNRTVLFGLCILALLALMAIFYF